MLRHAMMPPRSGGSPLALFRCCLSIDAHSLPPPGSSADLVAHLPEARFTKIMACNRGEIAVRIMRATTELDIASVGIYSHEDRHMQHRYKCDESYVLKGAQSVSPVGAYLDIDEIIRIALDAGVEAIHPGYGFLSENEAFARACEDNDIVFVGPTIDNLSRFAVRRREEERRSPALCDRSVYKVLCDARCAVRGARCAVCGVRCAVCGVRCGVGGSRVYVEKRS